MDAPSIIAIVDAQGHDVVQEGPLDEERRVARLRLRDQTRHHLEHERVLEAHLPVRRRLPSRVHHLGAYSNPGVR